MTEGRRADDIWQAVVIGAMAALCVATVWLQATTHLLMELGSGGRPLAWAESSSVLMALPAHVDEPREAFPDDVAAGLPGAAPFWATGSLVLLTLLAAAVGIAVLRVRSKSISSSSSFATAGDVKDLQVKRAEVGRVVLGHAHGRLVATQPEHSVLVVGATRSGKTTGFAMPVLQEWQGPAVVLSAKTDLLHATREAREQRGEVKVFDPTGVSGLPSDGWSPLARSTDWRGAVRAANAMSRLSGTTAGLGGSGHHWERVAAQLLAPLLLAAAEGGCDMGDVVRWVTAQDLSEPQALLEIAEAEVALTSLRAYAGLEARARDSAFSTARTVLDAYEDPDVVAATARWDIAPEWLLDGDRTLYLVATASDQTRLAPLFLALVDEVLRSAFVASAERRALSGSPFCRPDGTPAPRLLLMLDEAANIAPLPDLATLASTAGGEGVQLVTIFQDLSQVRHRYGTEWGSIASNHVAKVILPGVSDPETLSYFSSVVGEDEVEVTSKTAGGDRTTSTSTQQLRPILTQRDLRELTLGEGVCVYGSLPPLRLSLRARG